MRKTIFHFFITPGGDENVMKSWWVWWWVLRFGCVLQLNWVFSSPGLSMKIWWVLMKFGVASFFSVFCHTRFSSLFFTTRDFQYFFAPSPLNAQFENPIFHTRRASEQVEGSNDGSGFWGCDVAAQDRSTRVIAMTWLLARRQHSQKRCGPWFPNTLFGKQLQPQPIHNKHRPLIFLP